ncbi:MAG TPA: penicillin-binding protein 2 [Acetobacteraceae bacterium]|nr:penicillin-binding protein 2 [Acetobacteraceae bacterium]
MPRPMFRVGTRQGDKRGAVFTRRALLLMAGQAGALGALGVMLYGVQVREGVRYQVKARENSISTRLLSPPRGRITDRYGTVLAGNHSTWRALLIAEQAQDVDATLDAFSALIPLEPRERARIEREARRHRRFIPVLVRDFLSWDDMARIEVNAPDLPGIVVDAGTSRVYPTGPLFAHAVGYVAPPTEEDVADDPSLALPGMRVGRAGLEKTYEKTLRGKAGNEQLEVNAVGRVIREVAREEGQPGEDVRASVDAGLQQAITDRLGGESASAVVLDCRTGEVMAMVSNPSFDPSLFNSGVSQAQWQAWASDQRGPLTDKVTVGLYAPGSTFKMAVAIAALQARAITPGEHFSCPGYFDLGNMRFHCWRKGGHGSLDLRGGIKNSCDVYFYQVALKVGIDPIARTANRLGLGTELAIDLPDQRAGLIPTREWRRAQGHPWNLGDTVVSGIGQGYIQVTPLQLATYAARLATGRAVEPHLLADAAKEWPELGLPAAYLAAAREGMWAVVNEPGGTAPDARLPDPQWQLAGKTGSAQVLRVSREQREHGFDSSKLPWRLRPNALFVAFAPYAAPRYALSVVVEHGNAGATAAAPIARDIMMETLRRDPAGRSMPLVQPGPAQLAAVRSNKT